MTILQQKHFQCSNANETRKMQLGGGFYAQATTAVVSGRYLLETPYLCTSLMSSWSILVLKFGQETNGHGTHRWDEEDL